MKIGIIGAGNVGGTLGRRWAQGRHQVVFGVRDHSDPKLVQLLKEAGARAKAGSVTEAAAFGDVITLATPWAAVRSALEAAGDLAGKVLLDCTNPLKPDMSALELGHVTSGAEQIAAWAHGAKVVKIFNTTGYDNMADPKYGDESAVMFYCGDDTNAKATAHQLAADLGFDAMDAGQLKEARLLEPYALLWIHLAMGGQGRSIAFKLMRR
ncbi:MAG: NADPH-dependent F420 reductase [Terriglobia bacterium]